MAKYKIISTKSILGSPGDIIDEQQLIDAGVNIDAILGSGALELHRTPKPAKQQEESD
jgi:hypothetical protein